MAVRTHLCICFHDYDGLICARTTGDLGHSNARRHSKGSTIVGQTRTSATKRGVLRCKQSFAHARTHSAIRQPFNTGRSNASQNVSERHVISCHMCWKHLQSYGTNAVLLARVQENTHRTHAWRSWGKAPSSVWKRARVGTHMHGCIVNTPANGMGGHSDPSTCPMHTN